MPRGTGDTAQTPALRRSPAGCCLASGCDRNAAWRGFCEEHYPRTRACSIEGCERGHYAKGLCHMHYRRRWRGRAVGTAEVERRSSHDVVDRCSIEGCDRPHRAHGLCKLHYDRQHRGVSS